MPEPAVISPAATHPHYPVTRKKLTIIRPEHCWTVVDPTDHKSNEGFNSPAHLWLLLSLRCELFDGRRDAEPQRFGLGRLSKLSK